jgi:hypothetical protein
MAGNKMSDVRGERDQFRGVSAGSIRIAHAPSWSGGGATLAHGTRRQTGVLVRRSIATDDDQETNMAQIIRKAAIACGLAGALAIGAAAPSLAQFVVVAPGGPYSGGPYYGGPYGYYAAPYGYYRGYRHWNDPAGYDTGGMPYSYGELGWQPGPFSGAPANPCHPGLRSQNRC